MAVKRVELESIGTVALYKRKGSRNVRLSISHDGEVRVTLPIWAPYKVGLDFLKTKTAWIQSQQTVPILLEHGYRIGKAHHIHFESGQGSTISTRISGNEARILLPVGTRWDSLEAQAAAKKVGIKTLKKEAQQLLPNRLKTLADQHHFSFKDVSIKQLSGRWGSCNERTEIVLNCFLMQLPWDLIDYVLVHELVHTRVMAHGPMFWAEMDRVLPGAKELRSRIKTHKPIL